MLRSDYCSDYERQKSEFQNSIATIVATTPFKTDLNGQSSTKASIRKRKSNSLSSLAPPFGGASGSRRLAARAQASPFDIKAALAGRTLTPICRLQAEGEVMNETPYKICLRLNAEEAEKLIANAKACGQTRTAYLRRLLNGHDLRPRPTAAFEALRTEIHQIGNNINQIARKANAGFASHDEVTRALRMLDAVYGLLYEAGK